MKALMSILPKKSGRSLGKMTVRHQGGRHKRKLRKIDFRRDKKDVWGKVETIEYEPNRGANVAMIIYDNGERRYIMCTMKNQPKRFGKGRLRPKKPRTLPTGLI